MCEISKDTYVWCVFINLSPLECITNPRRRFCFLRTRIVCLYMKAGVEGATDVRSLLASKMKGEPNLVTGQLDNGFRYVILPNKLPPKRFEAHLEVHVGSVDELPNEQVHGGGGAWVQVTVVCHDCARELRAVGVKWVGVREGVRRL